MVDWTALKAAALVVAATAAVLLVGAALRFATRILSFAILALLVVGIGYAVYELAAGWTAAATETDRAADDRDRTDARDGADRRTRRTETELSDAEFERELADLLDDDEERRAEPDRTTERR